MKTYPLTSAAIYDCGSSLRTFDSPSPVAPRDSTAALEGGAVLFFPNLAFEAQESERALFSADIVGSAKNVSFDPRRGRVAGTTATGSDAESLLGLLSRFSAQTARLVDALLPEYRGRLDMGRTSFRPVEVAGRLSSWRKDDTRLHIDSFPATPVHGRRILRVFSNVNPVGRPRTWRLGEPFESLAERFARDLRWPTRGSASVLRLFRVTKSPRSPYDALMLQLHDRMKSDTDYQARVAQVQFEFPAGSTWIVFTDQVSHAAMSGQYQLEQTFLLPVDAMVDAQRSPLRVLERLVGRSLVP
jgi:3-deoxy-D-manno-octulosonic acid hydroxylase-like protein